MKTIERRRLNSAGLMLMICKGVQLNIVFLAVDSEGLEAWRQLTEKYEPNTVCRATDVLPVLLIPR